MRGMTLSRDFVYRSRVAKAGRKVRTPAGAKFFNLPIGAPITGKAMYEAKKQHGGTRTNKQSAHEAQETFMPGSEADLSAIKHNKDAFAKFSDLVERVDSTKDDPAFVRKVEKYIGGNMGMTAAQKGKLLMILREESSTIDNPIASWGQRPKLHGTH